MIKRIKVDSTVHIGLFLNGAFDDDTTQNNR